MKQRLILIGAGVLLLVVVVRLITSRPGGGEDVAVDTTGASAVAGSAGHAAPGADGTPVVASATRGATPAPKPAGPTPTPVVVQIQGTAVSVATKPLLLLNPSTVRQGSSVGVAGSGFDPGATVEGGELAGHRRRHTTLDVDRHRAVRRPPDGVGGRVGLRGCGGERCRGPCQDPDGSGRTRR